jgi:integrase
MAGRVVGTGAHAAGTAKAAKAAEVVEKSEKGEKGAARRRGHKRADGEGTIDQTRFEGWHELTTGKRVWRGNQWRGRVTIDGERHTVWGTSQEEVVTKLTELKARGAQGMIGTAEKDTLAAFLTEWLATKQSKVRLRTHVRYAQLMTKHVVPALGKTKRGALKPAALERLYGAKLAAGLSPRTVHHIHTVLHTALEQALKWGYVPRNVAAVVSPPAVPEKETRWPTSDEVRRLIGAATADRLRGLWALAAYTGMRQGELLGLTWNDVDLDAGVVHVRRILVKVKERRPTYGEPKTKRSRRQVPLTEDAVAALRAHKARQAEEKLALGPEYAGYNLVFATQLGTPLAGTVVQAGFKRALARADLPRAIRFHDLRHAAATMMLGNGVDVPATARILGHARNSTTLDVYGHAVPSKLGDAVAALQRALRGA